MRKILVTGGAGYIGSHTCKALAQQGYTPVVYDNLSEGHREFVQWGSFYQGDVRDVGALNEVFKIEQPQAVIHFAASAYVGESVQNPQKYYDNNVSGALALLSVMREQRCQSLVFSSTCAVYGVPSKLPIGLAEKPAPINPYGQSKLMVEQIIHDCSSAFDLNAVVLRYFNAAGADIDCKIGERHIPETHLIPNVINAGLDGTSKLQVFGDDYPTLDGTCVRDYVHVNDLASAHVKALGYLESHTGVHTFNLGTQNGVSVKQVIDAVQAQLGTAVPHTVCPRRAGDPAELVADSGVTEHELGWSAEHSGIENIVATAIDWARKERDIN